jgi:hypothetical protein
MNKGELNEAKMSQIFHSSSLPFLVSSVYLREKNLGQIDICFIRQGKDKNKVLNVVEVKSAGYISRLQVNRLKRASDHLGQVLGIAASFKVNFCQKDDHSLFF